jgi:Do/DeqQ family serine protease
MKLPLFVRNKKIMKRTFIIFSLVFTILITSSMIFRVGVVTAEETPADEEVPATLNLTFDYTDLDRSNQGIITSYADMLDGVTPSVVGVVTRRIINVMPRRGVDPQEEFFRRFFGLPPQQETPQQQAPREESVPSGLGSGVIISSDGIILTNNHVIAEGRRGTVADEIIVRLHNGRELPAEVIGRDPRTDIAVLRVKATDLPALTFADSDRSRVGDVVFAIGNPFSLGATVTQGIISATRRTNLGILGQGGYEDFIQTDASINRGNSGGALVDAHGRLVGINTAIFTPSGGNIGIGFAIPANMARNIAESLVTQGRVPRGFLGVVPVDLDSDLAEAFGLDSNQGALIQEVSPGLPADEAGIQHGDIVRTINGRPVNSAAELRLMISQLFPGTTAQLGIVRDGEKMTIDVVLGDLEMVAGGPGSTVPAARSPLPGIELAPVTEEFRDQFNIAEGVEGMVVTEVANDSPLRRVLAPGAVIIEANGVRISNVEDLRNGLRSGPNRLYIWQRGAFSFVAFRL